MENEKCHLCSENCVHEETISRISELMPDEDALYDVASLFKIFGDATRIRIMFILFTDEMCVCDIAKSLDMTQSAISHQLRILKQARLVKSRRSGKTIFYSLADAHVKGIFYQAMEHILEKR
ncbi:MAG: metalloregulator ArsR/SmtB family transcription factor [Oscillospiraceae bacterium]|nr:metalloregulator ArsR/SmtB family transcription factor [Oscillospiraceae bacterium]